MWDKERWHEIFQSMRKNKLRTVLTGFTVAFAIMLFTILFGIGKGLHNTFKEQFARDADNLVMIFAGKTSKAYKGFQMGRKIQFKNDDNDYLIDRFGKQMEYVSPLVSLFSKVTYKSNSDRYQIRGVYPDFHIIEENQVSKGRLLRVSDLRHHMKNVVIGRKVEEDLFNGRSGLSKYINIGGINFMVVGVFTDPGGDRDERYIYMPLTTLQKTYTKNDHINRLTFTYKSGLSNKEAIALGKEVKKALKQKHQVSPDDQNAIFVFNKAESQQSVAGVMMLLNVLVLIIGLGTLIAGIIGVSNIMVYVVRERTKELGIRKALGATPSSIVAMILQETILITAVSGYVGLLAGTLILHYAKPVLEERFIKNPSVSTGLVVGATIVLILAGMLAGYLPAKRAARIKPVIALQAK